MHVYSPHLVRLSRITVLYALALLITCGIGFSFLAPHIVASEEVLSEEYVVQPGDTLSGIAVELGIPIEVLTELNDLDDVDHIISGTRVRIPESRQTVPVAADRTYRVQPGDTLWEIAGTFGIKPLALADLNGLAHPDQIAAGTELRVPAATTETEPPLHREHRVEVGENLSTIAEDYGVTIAALKQTNGLNDVDLIRIGQTLVIPDFALPELSPGTAAILDETSSEFGIDQHLLLALSLMESGWQSHVVSHTGAVGLMQVMPDTAKWAVEYLAPEATNWDVSIEDNARVGAAFLDHLLFLEGGDVEGALASYYQGWASYTSDGMFEETRDYVDDVLALAERLRSQVD